MKFQGIVAAWEARSQKYKNALEGVLPKSFPRPVNLYLDKWMFDEVSASIGASDQETRVLDVGCGYGRLAGKLLKKDKRFRVWGTDVSKTYVSIFNQELGSRGKAQVAPATELPFNDSFFDHVFMVTTLMYVLSKKDLRKVFSEVFRVLKPGGAFVLIERDPVGYGFVTLWGIVSFLRGKHQREIKARSFSPKDILSFSGKSGFEIERMRGIPATTLFLPMIIVLGKMKAPLAERLLEVTGWFDKRLKSVLVPSLYVSYTLNK